MRIEHYFSFLSNQYSLCQTKYSPNIIDSPVDDAGEAVNLCVAQIKDRLAKANDVPWGYFIKEMQDINDITFYHNPYMMTNMEIAMELARVNIRPMAPPNSGPRDLEF